MVSDYLLFQADSENIRKFSEYGISKPLAKTLTLQVYLLSVPYASHRRIERWHTLYCDSSLLAQDLV
ncbi:MAG: hypothetical protein KME55_24845 [Nostoc indistinguendum CM1-VF10]|jgi:hypothetical protein|nr:hypothetical protein [Nostoc indistinguendum CM1-VF10]